MTIHDDFRSICIAYKLIKEKLNTSDGLRLEDLLDFTASVALEPATDPVLMSLQDIQEIDRQLFHLDSHKEKAAIDLFNQAKRLWISFIKESEHDPNTLMLFANVFFNCALVEKCLRELDKEDSEKLAYEDRLFYQVNYCTVLSRLRYFGTSFTQSMYQLNQDIRGIEIINYDVLFRLGRLNFSIHNYKEALFYLIHARRVFESQNKEEDKQIADDCYFQIRLLICYCYEYLHQFDNAIKELVGVEPPDFIKALDKTIKGGLDSLVYDPFNDDRRDRVIQIVHHSITEDADVFCVKTGLLWLAKQRDNINPEEMIKLRDLQEALHSLAHCCNEYGIQQKQKNDTLSLPLITIARALMLNVAKNYPVFGKQMDYDTCLAMIYAEDKDYEICFHELELTMANSDYSKQSQAFRSECDFYYYFITNTASKLTNEDINKKSKEAYERFINYCQKNNDYDARTHIEIFKFRFGIIQVLKDIFKNFSQAPYTVETFKQDFDTFTQFTPSIYVNKWVRQEYEKLKATYEFLVALISADRTKINRLYNFADRYMQFHNAEQKSKRSTSVLETIHAHFFPEKKGIDNYQTSGKLETTGVRLIDINRPDNNEAIKNARQKINIVVKPVDVRSINISPALVFESEITAQKVFFSLVAFSTLIQDLLSPQSIFILAPLSSALPYQYQTGEFDELITAITNNIYIPKLQLSLLSLLSTPLHINAWETPEEIKGLFTRVNANGQKSQIKLLIRGKASDAASDDQWFYSYSNTHSKLNLKRPIHMNKSLTRSLEFLSGIIDEANQAYRHDPCPHCKGQCLTKTWSYQECKTDPNVAQLLREFSVDINQIDPQDKILVNIIFNGDNSTYLYSLIVADKDIDVIEVMKAVCSVPDPTPQISIFNPQNNQQEPFIVVCYDSRLKELVQSDLRWFNDHGVDFWYDDAVQPGTQWDTANVFKYLSHEKCKKALVYFNASSFNDAQGLFRELQKIHDEKYEFIPIGVGFGSRDQIDRLNEVIGRTRSDEQKHDLLNKLFPVSLDYIWRSEDNDNISHLNDEGLRRRLGEWGFKIK